MSIDGKAKKIHKGQQRKNTRNEEDYKRAKKLRWFGIDRDAKINNNWKCLNSKREVCMDMVEAGYKFHMNDIAAVVGLVGLKHSDKMLERRREICEYYYKNINKEIFKVFGGSCWLFGLILNKVNRDEFSEKLTERGVNNDLVHLRNDIFTVFGGKRKNLPNMNWVESRYLYIPLHCNLSDDDIKYVVDCVNEVYDEIS